MYLIDEVQFVKTDENEIIMLNLINAAADIIDKDTYHKIKNNISKLDEEVINKLKERNYLFDSKDKYEEYIKNLNFNIRVKRYE